MVNNTKQLFFELLQVFIGARDVLSQLYKEKEWNDVLEMADEQAVTGLLLSALERLPLEQRAPKMLLLQWIGEAQQIEQNTAALTKSSEEVLRFFHENGFACTLLKGAAVGRYYPEPLRRSSGDIDVWIEGGRERIYDFARKFDKDGKLDGVNYHHIHLPIIEGVLVEAHIWPSFLNNPIHNYRLHQFCDLYSPKMDNTMPSLSFDRIFILLHAFQHFCGHGIGMRQVIDYYYVLKASFTEIHNNHDYGETVKWVRSLGMERFACGIMWIMKDLLGMPNEWMPWEPDEKEGQFILYEIMQTGNMGHSDIRNWGSLKTPMSRFFFNLRRDIYLVRHYPSEVIWQPFFSIWLYFWRLSKGLLSRD